jgi:hypothetical protein
VRANGSRLLALLIFGFCCDPAAAGPEATDMHLEDAGFIARFADTPQTIARLRDYPARKFLRRVKNGKPYYLYIDPDSCKCVFLGSESAMKTYRDMVSSGRLRLPGYVASGGVDPERLIMDADNIDGNDIPEGDIYDYNSGY